MRKRHLAQSLEQYSSGKTGKAVGIFRQLNDWFRDENAGSFTDTLYLKDTLNRFLEGLSESARELFMLRYWYMLPVKEAAKRCGVKEGTARMSLSRTRAELKTFLEKEGYDI